MSDLLVVDGLMKTFRSTRARQRTVTHAVDDVSFSLAAGRTLAIVGESGAGKSTVGRMVLRLIEPDAGRVELAGTDLLALGRRELRHTRSRVQMVFQDPYTSLDPRTTVGRAVEEPFVVHTDLSRDERRERAAALLESVGLDRDHMDRMPREMSGGQLQRVAIARALATGPELLVCDEPVSALDVSIRAQIINLLLDLQEERHLAILFISHDLSLVRTIAHDVGVMRAGQLIELRPTQELFAAPREEYTAELLESIPGTHRRERRREHANHVMETRP